MSSGGPHQVDPLQTLPPPGVPTHTTIPTCCGPWHSGTWHFVTCYPCPEYWSILDPLRDSLLDPPRMQFKLHRALRGSFTFQNLPIPSLPAYRQLPMIAIQRDAPGLFGAAARSRYPPHFIYSSRDCLPTLSRSTSSLRNTLWPCIGPFLNG